ncbi:aldolase/citrate lyase family protein [Rhodoferax sp.]|uniref:HpcH/HpaI aldolase family protein n=1 Tax=Rhodoferax sp. TaxID=50421 RepID=UPI00262EE57E|nr:aldolase/citrate lyase family protein [Rhodoferax sp.]MDD2924728.1 aldolase/citrate lyase family protein [Rhodoferax sp.]
MRHNRIKQSLQAGQTSVGCWLTLGSPAVAEAMSHCGFDWLLIDAEHGPNGIADIAAQLRAVDAANANGATIASAVRVQANDAALVKRAMDCGAQTIMFPAIDSVAEATAAIAATRFPRHGNGGVRGVAGLVRAGRFGLDPDYTSQANQNACAVLQIETALGLQNVEGIAALDGADCLFVGPADLSASMGYLGQMDHPEVLVAIERVLTVCQRAGKAAGIFAGSAEEAAHYRDRGFAMIALHSDVAWLTRGAKHALAHYTGVSA